MAVRNLWFSRCTGQPTAAAAGRQYGHARTADSTTGAWIAEATPSFTPPRWEPTQRCVASWPPQLWSGRHETCQALPRVLLPRPGDRQPPGPRLPQARQRQGSRRLVRPVRGAPRRRRPPPPAAARPVSGPRARARTAPEVLGRISQGVNVDDRRTTVRGLPRPAAALVGIRGRTQAEHAGQLPGGDRAVLPARARPRPAGRPAGSPLPRPVRGDAADQPARARTPARTTCCAGC